MTSIKAPTFMPRLNLRQQAEREIVSKVIKALHDAGLAVTVNDGEEDVVERSFDHNECLEAMFSTDEDYLFAHDPATGTTVGWVRFIYGNDGHDVINDYTTNLEETLTSALAAADRWEEALS